MRNGQFIYYRKMTGKNFNIRQNNKICYGDLFPVREKIKKNIKQKILMSIKKESEIVETFNPKK